MTIACLDGEAAPVVRRDGASVGGGGRDPIWERVHGLFAQHARRRLRGELD